MLETKTKNNTKIKNNRLCQLSFSACVAGCKLEFHFVQSRRWFGMCATASKRRVKIVTICAFLRRFLFVVVAVAVLQKVKRHIFQLMSVKYTMPTPNKCTYINVLNVLTFCWRLSASLVSRLVKIY